VTSTAGTFGVAMVPFTEENYHTNTPIAAGRLRFFSGVLRTLARQEETGAAQGAGGPTGTKSHS